MMQSNNKSENFKDVQNVFTQHIRDPEKNPAPHGIEDRRINIYRELIYNNIESFIANSFPVLRKITGDKQWHEMLRDYVKRHQSHTPLFPKMPLEFLRYLEQERGDHENDVPFFLELAHYEWIETALAIDTRELDFTGIERTGDLLKGVLVLNPLSLVVAYTWPVHEISPSNLPDNPPAEKTYIIVYRDQTHQVKFMVLNPVAAKLIEYIKNEEELSGETILKKIAQELNHPNPQFVIAGGHEMLQEFVKKEVLLGIKH